MSGLDNRSLRKPVFLSHDVGTGAFCFAGGDRGSLTATSEHIPLHPASPTRPAEVDGQLQHSTFKYVPHVRRFSILLGLRGRLVTNRGVKSVTLSLALATNVSQALALDVYSMSCRSQNLLCRNGEVFQESTAESRDDACLTDLFSNGTHTTRSEVG